MAAAFRSRRARRYERGFLSNRAVAIHTIDFDRGTRLAVDFSVAVIVLSKMTIIALHPFFKMDVRKVDCFAETIRVVKGNLPAVLVQPVPFAVVIEDGPENPAMAVEIGELRGLQLLVEFGTAHILEEFFVAPEAADCRAFRIAFERLMALFFSWMALLLRIHFVAIYFVVPPRKSEICRDHVRTRMDVADHALAGGNRPRENVFDGMAGLVLQDRRIRRCAVARVAKRRISAGVQRIAV